MKIDIYNTDKKYNIIYADPPWSYKDKRTDKKISGGAESHYKTMQIADIKEMGVKAYLNSLDYRMSNCKIRRSNIPLRY